MMHVDVIIDVVCPWCYVGKRRLDQAIAACDEPIDVQYRPFLLAPDMPREGKDRKQHFAEKFGANADVSKMTEHLRSQAQDIDFQFETITRVPNTVDAHRLIGWAYAQSRQSEVVEAVFAAYFTQGEDIGCSDVLAKIAGACGMDSEIVAHLLQTDKDAATVRSSAMQASGMGIQGVPFYIFGGAVALSGAQSPDVLLQGVTKAKEAAAA
ncbi:MAG: DsbA family oxidoreductase [Pseudomonadota bacterium]